MPRRGRAHDADADVHKRDETSVGTRDRHVVLWAAMVGTLVRRWWTKAQDLEELVERVIRFQLMVER